MAKISDKYTKYKNQNRREKNKYKKIKKHLKVHGNDKQSEGKLQELAKFK